MVVCFAAEFPDGPNGPQDAASGGWLATAIAAGAGVVTWLRDVVMT
jgi:hypothetical protein